MLRSGGYSRRFVGMHEHVEEGFQSTVAGQLATGGTPTLINQNGVNYVVHSFTTVGNATFTPSEELDVEYLVVGGGGGGGFAADSWNMTYYASGGGGAGVVNYNKTTITQPQAVVVGAGGLVNADGGQSSLSNGVVSLGGYKGTVIDLSQKGKTGGDAGSGPLWGGSSTFGGGGGGGGGSASSASAENGGRGITIDITGTAVEYGVGGNGAAPCRYIGSGGDTTFGSGGRGFARACNTIFTSSTASAGIQGVVIVRYFQGPYSTDYKAARKAVRDFYNAYKNSGNTVAAIQSLSPSLATLITTAETSYIDSATVTIKPGLFAANAATQQQVARDYTAALTTLNNLANLVRNLYRAYALTEPFLTTAEIAAAVPVAADATSLGTYLTSVGSFKTTALPASVGTVSGGMLYGITVLPNNKVVYSEQYNQTIGILGSAITATHPDINGPTFMTSDTDGNIYFTDQPANIILKGTPTAGGGFTISVIAGTPSVSGSADGVGTTAAQFKSPIGICVDKSKNLFVTDTSNHTIRKLTPQADGTYGVSTIAGAVGTQGSTDGRATYARFRNPSGIAVDGMGNLYVADRSNHTVRKLVPSASGDYYVSTIAGKAGSSGNMEGPFNSSVLTFPSGICVSSTGVVYVTSNPRVIYSLTPLYSSGIYRLRQLLNYSAEITADPRGLALNSAEDTLYYTLTSNSSVYSVPTWPALPAPAIALSSVPTYLPALINAFTRKFQTAYTTYVSIIPSLNSNVLTATGATQATLSATPTTATVDNSMNLLITYSMYWVAMVMESAKATNKTLNTYDAFTTALSVFQQAAVKTAMVDFYTNTYLPGLRYLTAADGQLAAIQTAATKSTFYAVSPTGTEKTFAALTGGDTYTSLGTVLSTGRTTMVDRLVKSYSAIQQKYTGFGMTTTSTVVAAAPTVTDANAATTRTTYLGATYWPQLLLDVRAFVKARVAAASYLRNWATKLPTDIIAATSTLPSTKGLGLN